MLDCCSLVDMSERKSHCSDEGSGISIYHICIVDLVFPSLLIEGCLTLLWETDGHVNHKDDKAVGSSEVNEPLQSQQKVELSIQANNTARLGMIGTKPKNSTRLLCQRNIPPKWQNMYDPSRFRQRSDLPQDELVSSPPPQISQSFFAAAESSEVEQRTHG